MNNPWMSAWMSAANSVANRHRAHVLCEMRRQQDEIAKIWTDAGIQFWMALWFPWLPHQKRRK